MVDVTMEFDMQQLTLEETEERTCESGKVSGNTWDDAAIGGNPNFVMGKTRSRPTRMSSEQTSSAGWEENDASG